MVASDREHEAGRLELLSTPLVLRKKGYETFTMKIGNWNQLRFGLTHRVLQDQEFMHTHGIGRATRRRTTPCTLGGCWKSLDRYARVTRASR